MIVMQLSAATPISECRLAGGIAQLLSPSLGNESSYVNTVDAVTQLWNSSICWTCNPQWSWYSTAFSPLLWRIKVKSKLEMQSKFKPHKMVTQHEQPLKPDYKLLDLCGIMKLLSSVWTPVAGARRCVCMMCIVRTSSQTSQHTAQLAPCWRCFLFLF